jgi:hypothetical protein
MVSFVVLLISDGGRKTFAPRFVELLSCDAELHQSDKDKRISNLGNLLCSLSASLAHRERQVKRRQMQTTGS